MTVVIWAAAVLAAFLVALSQWVEVRLRYRGEGPSRGLEVCVAGFGGRAVYRTPNVLRRPLGGAGAAAVAGVSRTGVEPPPDLGRSGHLLDTVRSAIADYRAAVDYLTARAVGVRVEVAVAVGTGEAATTGLLAGAGWAVLGNLAVGLQRNLPPGSARPVFRVVPDYHRRVFEASLDCIFKVRAGHIIGAAVRLLRTDRRRRTERD